ncbi:MAG: hypothetical protein ACR2MP_19050, partial [Streptosporangiaceae bacterium]
EDRLPGRVGLGGSGVPGVAGVHEDLRIGDGRPGPEGRAAASPAAVSAVPDSNRRRDSKRRDRGSVWSMAS